MRAFDRDHPLRTLNIAVVTYAAGFFALIFPQIVYVLYLIETGQWVTPCALLCWTGGR